MIKELRAMKVGTTKVINSKVVTRWGQHSWEVGTWGKSLLSIQHAISEILSA